MRDIKRIIKSASMTKNAGWADWLYNALGKPGFRGMSDEHRADIDRRLEMQRRGLEMRNAARRSLTPARYANPANIIGPDAQKRREQIAFDEAMANTRIGYSGQNYPINPYKKYFTHPAVPSNSPLMMFRDQGHPGDVAFTVARERALDSLRTLS